MAFRRKLSSCYKFNFVVMQDPDISVYLHKVKVFAHAQDTDFGLLIFESYCDGIERAEFWVSFFWYMPKHVFSALPQRK